MVFDADFWERAAARFETPTFTGLGLRELAVRFDQNSVQTPALDLIDAELETLVSTPGGRLIISMPPQEGKSVRCSKVLPVAVLKRNPDLRIIMGSYGHDLARRNSRSARDAIISHPELGLRVRADVSAQNEWQLEGHDGGVYAAGVGTALTGRPGDFVIIDDPVKDREEADSEVMRERAWNWLTDTVYSRLSKDAPVLVIMTRWHDDDLVGRILKAPDAHRWRVVNIPAQADHDPGKGEVDPLGREPGEFMESARGRTREQWEQRKVAAGSRGWNALYQGRPSPAEGGLFKRSWWKFFDYDLWLSYPNGMRYVPGDDVELCMSVDCAFKDLATSDFVVLQVWMRRGAHVFLLDQVRERLSFTDTCVSIRTLAGKWPQAVAKYVEDKANGPAVMNALHKTVPGLIPVEPEGSKAARAAAVTPYVEAGNVWLPAPELAPWVDGFVEELAAFPTGSNDDQVDATSQALNRLLLAPWLDLGVVEPEEFDDDHRVHISRY